jgi:hypothetical protein
MFLACDEQSGQYFPGSGEVGKKRRSLLVISN